MADRPQYVFVSRVIFSDGVTTDTITKCIVAGEDDDAWEKLRAYYKDLASRGYSYPANIPYPRCLGPVIL